MSVPSSQVAPVIPALSFSQRVVHWFCDDFRLVRVMHRETLYLCLPFFLLLSLFYFVLLLMRIKRWKMILIHL